MAQKIKIMNLNQMIMGATVIILQQFWGGLVELVMACGLHWLA
jgi:hypothetical protein